MSIDHLLDREYHREDYNCLHFAAECWSLLTGDKRLHVVREHQIQGQGLAGLFRGMTKHRAATEAPSLALMETLDGQLHIAVCFRRRLLHINETGCQFMPVDAYNSTYRNMRFYS